MLFIQLDSKQLFPTTKIILRGKAISKNEDIEVFVSSGNIFEDLNYPNPTEAQAKAELARQIHQVIESKNLTQKEAAEIMGISQPKVSDIIRGKLSKYTLDRLIRFLRLLGRDIEIRIKKRTSRSKPARLSVVGIKKRSRKKKVLA